MENVSVPAEAVVAEYREMCADMSQEIAILRAAVKERDHQIRLRDQMVPDTRQGSNVQGER